MGDKSKQPMYVDKLSMNDVLLGRGTGPNDHPGNKNYRHLIRQRKDEYTRTTKRSEKNDIAEWLFDKITAEQNGRFLKAVEVNFPGRKTQTKYVVVDKSVAMEKIRQSLRQSLNRPKPSPGANGSENEDGYPKAVSPSNLHPTAATASPTNGNKHRNEPPETQSAPSKKARQEPPRNHLQTPPPPYDLQRYKLVLSYDGTRFSGWQRQSSNSSKDAHSRPPKNIRDMKKRHHDAMGKVISIPVTVQESLEDALEMYSGLDRPSLRMRMAGRTDAGVHANGQTVAVSLPKPGSKGSTVQDVELWQIRRAINSRLPMDISVNDISICDESFDPRHDVISKQYSYTIRYRRKMSNDKGEVLPICEKGGPQLLRTAFDPSCLWIVPWALDDSKMEQYCELLKGDHDFSPFVHKQARNSRDNCKSVTRFACTRIKVTLPEDGVYDVRFEIEASGFGRSQVRNFVGFIVDLCRGAVPDHETVSDWLWKESAEEVAKRGVIHAAPASGLCLEKVEYARTDAAAAALEMHIV